MGRIYDGIDDHLRDWIARQPLFFVGTAPLGRRRPRQRLARRARSASLRVLDDHTVAYLDVIGSGAETIAHLRENGRIVVMLCAFEGPPRILRLHGRGEVRAGRRPRASTSCSSASASRSRTIARVAPRDRRRRRHPDRRLVRLRRAADGLRGRAPAPGRVGARSALRVGGPGGARRLPARAQRREPRRPAGRHALSTAAQPFSSRMTIQGGRCVPPVSILPA